MQKNTETELVLLLRRAQEGEERALEELLTELYVPIKRFLGRRLSSAPGAHELVQDFAQEVLARVHKSLTDCRAESEGELVAWVLAIARNVIADHLRSPDGLALAHLSQDLDLVLEGPSRARWEWEQAEPSPATSLLLRLLLRSYAELPEDTAYLVWRRVMEAASWEALAREVGTTASAAKRRYQRAQQRLRGQVIQQVRQLPEHERALLQRYLAQQ